MCEEAFELMRVLFSGIVADEARAMEVARIADEADRRGRHGEAEALRVVARHHRIRSLEARAHIAMLDDAFGPLSREP